MEKQTTYKTKQRERILDYLKTVPGEHVTVTDICAHLKQRQQTVGQTTVYRHLERLVDEGVVNKYNLDSNSPACFEFIPDGEHCKVDSCYHCKCEKCGKLIHLHCDEMKEFAEHLNQHHQFVLDSKRTVFYGICDECRAVM